MSIEMRKMFVNRARLMAENAAAELTRIEVAMGRSAKGLDKPPFAMRAKDAKLIAVQALGEFGYNRRVWLRQWAVQFPGEMPPAEAALMLNDAEAAIHAACEKWEEASLEGKTVDSGQGTVASEAQGCGCELAAADAEI
jgi:hypothetical protein